MIYKVATALALVGAASATLYTEDHTYQKNMWEGFKKSFGKSYKTMEEEQSRFAIFVENLKMADHRNELELKSRGSAVHGITRFSDMSQAEFESTMLTSDPSKRTNSAEVHVSSGKLTTSGSKDWTNDLTTAVRDQGYCGSCWAFSATEQIESDWMRLNGGKISFLSVEQTTQCSDNAYGCGGGWTESAYDYVKAHEGGLAYDSQYPYTSYQGVTGVCKDSGLSGITINGYKTFGRFTETTDMTDWMINSGPISICVDASNWSSYTGGVMSNCGKSTNHCVQAVGVNTDAVIPYWNVRNSWNTNWGESGFIRLKYGENTCNMASDATYTY